MTIRVLIVDDHKVVRQGLQSFLALDQEIEVIGAAINGQEALEQTAALNPEVVLMDLQMPGMDGFEATRLLRQRFPEVKVLVLTSSLQQDDIARAIGAGANGYLLKDMEGLELCQSIKTVSSSQIVLSNKAASLFVQPGLPGEPSKAASHVMTEEGVSQKFTPREVEVLQLLSGGLTNKEIAYLLNLSEKTVKVHLSIIMAKLNAQSRTQAALQAVRLGIVKPVQETSKL